MGFGMKCWDSSGNVTLDIVDTINRLRYQTTLGSDESGSIILPDIAGRQTTQFALCAVVPPAEKTATSIPQGYASHIIYREATSTKISWSNVSTRHKPVATSLLLVFLYT